MRCVDATLFPFARFPVQASEIMRYVDHHSIFYKRRAHQITACSIDRVPEIVGASLDYRLDVPCRSHRSMLIIWRTY